MLVTVKPASRTLRRPSAIVLAAFVAGAVPFALHAWAALHGSFDQDDFIVTYRAAQTGPFDLGFLFQDYHGHLAPGGFFLAALITWWSPLDFPLLMAPLLLMQAAAVVLCWAVLVRCFGRRWAILVPFTVFTASTLLLVPTLWWSFGIQLVPLVLAMTAAAHAHVRYLRDGGRWRIATLAWTVFGLAFYEKAAVIPILLVAITVWLGVPLRRHLTLWLGHAAVLGGFAILFLARTSSQVANGPGQVSAGTVADTAGRMVGDTLLPGLLGGPWSGPGAGAIWAPSPVFVSVGLTVAALVVLIAGVRVGGARARGAWALLGLAFAVDVVLVAATRLTEVGPEIGDDPRFVADLVLIAVLCGAFAFLTPLRVDGAEPGSPSASPPGERERTFALVVSVLLIASSVVGFSRLAPALRFDHSRQYIANVRAAVELDPELVLFDTFVPKDVVHEWFADDSRASRVVGLLPGIRFDEPAGRMHLLDANGNPQRITGVTPVSRSVPGLMPDCGTLVGETLVSIPLDTPVLGRHLLKVDYYTSDGGEGIIESDRVRTPVWFQAGLHSVYLPADGLFDRIGIKLSGGGAPICVPKIEAGIPVT